MKIEPNSYSIGDAIEFTRALKGHVKGIICSPPYNKRENRVRDEKERNKAWDGQLLQSGYSDFTDDLPHEEYVKQQREFLQASLDSVGDDGLVLYNINRKHYECLENRREDILAGLPVRQTIIWNRKSSCRICGKGSAYLMPAYEFIFMLAGKNWKVGGRFVNEISYWSDVWTIKPENASNPHPAPFPIELALRMCKLVDAPVADPYAGSGTTGLAAESLDLPYYLNDLSVEYKQMFEDRKTNSIQTEMII